ncbi:MAG TPA: hypothetical protein VF070_06790 [Streptosporangiaceae bacterium]
MAKRTKYQITIDDALTKALNQKNPIHDHMANCAASLYQRFNSDSRVFFYVKGSAALSRYLRTGGIAADVVDDICARSDWDTQLVINPWLSRAEWFAAFLDCQDTIRGCLDQFEEQLLEVFTRIYPPLQPVDQRLLQGKSADPNIRSGQNGLAKTLREGIAGEFGQLFLDASREAGYVDVGPNHWDLPWPNINSLVPARVKDILELDIQAHSQATLTSALMHPGQALDNLNSVMTGQELMKLKATTQTAAEQAWTAMVEASDAYDQLWTQVISAPPVVDLLKEKILVSVSEVSLISSLPQEIIEGTIQSMPGPYQGPLIQSWKTFQYAKTQQLVDEKGDPLEPIEEVRFAKALGASLTANPDVARQLGNWCLTNMTVQPAVLTATAALYEEEIASRLSPEQKRQLDAAREEVEARLDRYREEPDPEDVAEAQKRETEIFAPFTLVSVEKGSRKVASILENMTIGDFYLFRLMIRCQLSNKDPNNRLIPDAPPNIDFDVFKQQFKFRAELLDISVPRDDSLETAEQWAHVRDHIKTDGQGIPLPDGSYFLDEYVLMFREVLDKSSSSVHKLTKRLKRACLIADVYARELGDGLVARYKLLANRYPVFDEALTALKGNVRPANLLVFMRMCEQLVDSYDLAWNLRLRDDSRQMMLSFVPQINAFLTTPLTHQTFLELMTIYTHLSRLIYNETFLLGSLRQKHFTDDKLTGEVAAPAVTLIDKTFTDAGAPIRCAVVEDFAIKDEPDLPDPLKKALPLNVLTIIAYTNEASGGLIPQVAGELGERIRALEPGQFDTVADGNTLYARRLQELTVERDPGWAALSVPQQAVEPGKQLKSEVVVTALPAVFLKIKFVIDDNTENWIAPAHQRDLRAIVKQYRRSLPAYTEYHVLTQKKNILAQMEKALTTY